MQEPVHDTLAEFCACGKFVIDVERVVVSGKARKGGDVLRRDGAVKALGLTDLQFREAVWSTRNH
jgi:hypothetical protein